MPLRQHLDLPSLPTILCARSPADPAKEQDLESADARGLRCTAGASDAVASDADNWEKYQRSWALLLGVASLMFLQIVTHIFTAKLYTEAKKEPPFYHKVRFYMGLVMSISLLVLGVAAASLRNCVNEAWKQAIEKAWKRAIGALAAWASFCCAMTFASMVQCFPLTCSFYPSTGVLGDETITFTHIDCPRLLGDVPARVVTTFMGHIYAGAAIGVLGGLVVMKPQLMPVIPRVAIDFVDLQDFALLLIDDEILKTFWGQAEGGYGGEWLWWLVFAVCCFAVLSMFGELIYQYATTSDATDTSGASDERTRWSKIDTITNASSLLFVEIPFLVLRTYTSFRFDVPPSSLVLKNIFSICKEIWELYHQQRLKLGFCATVVGVEDQ
jgi:hypothetical protein